MVTLIQIKKRRGKCIGRKILHNYDHQQLTCYILQVTEEGSIMVVASHNATYSNLYVSDIVSEHQVIYLSNYSSIYLFSKTLFLGDFSERNNFICQVSRISQFWHTFDSFPFISSLFQILFYSLFHFFIFFPKNVNGGRSQARKKPGILVAGMPKFAGNFGFLIFKYFVKYPGCRSLQGIILISKRIF